MPRSKTKRSLVPTHGGEDRVMTHPALAAAIIAHFNPTGRILEPCRGDGPTYAFWREGWDYMEIQEGRDFLVGVETFPDAPSPETAHYDWILTNPPFSRFRAFLQRSMQVADNVVLLAPVNNFWLVARQRDMLEAQFGIKEILLVDTPPKSTGWPSSGFQIGATHLQRGHSGPITMSRAPSITYV